MAPVDLALLSRRGLEADEGPSLFRPHRSQIITEDGDLAGKAFGLESLQNNGGGGAGITAEQFADLNPKGVKQAAADHLLTDLLRVEEVFAHGFSVQAQQFGDFGLGISLVGIVVDGKNDAFIQHGRLAMSW